MTEHVDSIVQDAQASAADALGVVDIPSDINRFHEMGLLDTLLADRSTGGNIVWATNIYEYRGESFRPEDEILPSDITGKNSGVVCTRASKERDEQSALTKAHAEVFTPLWICKLMIDEADSAWNESPVSKDGDWKVYVESPRMEITCGEAPFLCSRYDAADGRPMSLDERIGILDRKLKLVNENTNNREAWLLWAEKACKATYGYEYQGDNLLMARINTLRSVEDHAAAAGYPLTQRNLETFVQIISWNLWQMDGLTYCVPFGIPPEEEEPRTLFDSLFPEEENKRGLALIYDWTQEKPLTFRDLRWRGAAMRFDYVIGNPPYQEGSKGANANDTPLYHYFFDGAFEVSDRVELISPARFLFKAGGTPHAWNEKMLNDKHIKVIMYEPQSAKVFPGKSISGGVAILYRDENKDYGSLGIFAPLPQLNDIMKKVDAVTSLYMDDMVSNRGLYRYSDLAYSDHPDVMKRTADRRIAPSCFGRMPELFTEYRPEDGYEYVRIYGVVEGGRGFRWIRKDYVSYVPNLDSYKVVISKADGAAGTLGNPIPARVCGKPVVIDPGDGFTETFISIGEAATHGEACAILRYVKSKFARALLGILKVTQNNAKPTWAKVPLQNWSQFSDIDWSQSVADIDRQLYAKYGLSDDEIGFIETHVKEME